MKTNISKFNYYKNIITNQEWEFFQTIKDYPKDLYKVYPTGILGTLVFSHFSYRYDISLFYHNKPDKEHVKKVAELAAKKIEFNLDMVQWHYEETHKDFKLSGALYLSKLPYAFFADKESAEKKAQEIILINEEFEKYAVKKNASFNYAGYKFLGWQNGWKYVYFDEQGNVTTNEKEKKSFGYLTSDYPEYGKCRDLKHRRIEVQHNNRGSENTVSCDICKIYWKYDSSD